jgi:fimbrial chaperone protein
MNLWKSRQRMAVGGSFAAILVFIASGLAANAQALSVIPVNVFLSPGQRTTTLTVTNQGQSSTSLQTRIFAWSQKDGEDQLTPTNDVVVSPPIVKVDPGASQVVRIALRQMPQFREGTYRILLDQIPGPAEPGVVAMVLRMSIPIFAAPTIRSFADVQFHLQRIENSLYLIGTNHGNLHEKLKDLELSTKDGLKLKTEISAVPYVLAGSSQRWHVVIPEKQPLSNAPLQLKATLNAGAVDVQVQIVPSP